MYLEKARKDAIMYASNGDTSVLKYQICYRYYRKTGTGRELCHVCSTKRYLYAGKGMGKRTAEQSSERVSRRWRLSCMQSGRIWAPYLSDVWVLNSVVFSEYYAIGNWVTKLEI